MTTTHTNTNQRFAVSVYCGAWWATHYTTNDREQAHAAGRTLAGQYGRSKVTDDCFSFVYLTNDHGQVVRAGA